MYKVDVFLIKTRIKASNNTRTEW